MIKKALVVIMMLCFITITGCENSKQDEVNGVPNAQVLYDARSSYIGDNSADLKLLELLNANYLGKFTIELEASQEPYILKVIFTDINKDLDEEEFKNAIKNNSILLLALIENADVIKCIYPIDGILKEETIKVEDTNKFLGKDIKEYGKSKDGIEKLINILYDKNN